MFDFRYYIKRNEEIAHQLYPGLIGPDRKVAGTNIWFDDCWRIHVSEDIDHTFSRGTRTEMKGETVDGEEMLDM